MMIMITMIVMILMMMVVIVMTMKKMMMMMKIIKYHENIAFELKDLYFRPKKLGRGRGGTFLTDGFCKKVLTPSLKCVCCVCVRVGGSESESEFTL